MKYIVIVIIFLNFECRTIFNPGLQEKTELNSLNFDYAESSLALPFQKKMSKNYSRLKSLKLKCPKYKLNRNASYQLTILGYFEEGDKRDITIFTKLTSDNTKIASVDTNGVITTGESGTTRISASYENQIIESCILTVTNPKGYYDIKVTSSGLRGELILQNNGADNIHISSVEIKPFKFPYRKDANYSIAITSQPSGQVCAIAGQTNGILSSDLTLKVNCIDGCLSNGNVISNCDSYSKNSFKSISTVSNNYSSYRIDKLKKESNLDSPIGVVGDGKNLFITDIEKGLVRKIEMGTNRISTLNTKPFNYPTGITTDGTNLYISTVNQLYKLVIDTGETFLLAGNEPGFLDGIGNSSRFNNIRSITTDGKNLYLTDYFNNAVRKIDLSSNIVSTIAMINRAWSIAVNRKYLFVSGFSTNRIYRIDLEDNSIMHVAGNGEVGKLDSLDGRLASFNEIYGLGTDGRFLYIMENGSKQIRKMNINEPYTVNTILPQNLGYLDGDIGIGKFCGETMCGNSSMAFDGENLYFADMDNHVIRRLK